MRSVEFFTAHSRNPHKRKAYAKAAAEFAPGVTNTASISSTRCNPSWRFAVPPTAVERKSDVIALRDEFLIHATVSGFRWCGPTGRHTSRGFAEDLIRFWSTRLIAKGFRPLWRI